jgi:glycosyltransferase involved in cell wall biosynthesis
MRSPTVSVVIPCSNQGRFLRDAVDSVLAQSVPARDIVVVDDGCDGEAASLAAGYRGTPGFKYIRHRSRSLATARNIGIQHSTGEFLILLDGDDRLRREAVATGLRELEAHPAAALVWGRCIRIDERGAPLPTVPPPPVVGDAYAALLRNNFIWTPAVVMFRRAMCAPLMRFDPAVEGSADYELYLRIVRQFPIHGHATVVAEYRLHGASMSRNASLMLTSTMEVLRAQRSYAQKRRTYAQALEQGRRSWQGYYGEQLIDQMARAARHPGRWLQAGAMAAVLARYYPRGLAAFVARTVVPAPNRIRTRMRAPATVVSETSRPESVEGEAVHSRHSTWSEVGRVL